MSAHSTCAVCSISWSHRRVSSYPPLLRYFAFDICCSAIIVQVARLEVLGGPGLIDGAILRLKVSRQELSPCMLEAEVLKTEV